MVATADVKKPLFSGSGSSEEKPLKDIPKPRAQEQKKDEVKKVFFTRKKVVVFAVLGFVLLAVVAVAYVYLTRYSDQVLEKSSLLIPFFFRRKN